jgi:anion-transporting  ArsA/GET3 family ATPase
MSGPTDPTLAGLLDSASVLVCTGAGGVGKTTTAAALALAAARRGRRVVVVTVDPAKRLADAIGVSLAHEPTRVPDTGQPDDAGELWATMLDTRATFDDLVRRYSGTSVQTERILGNRFYRNISGSLSGTQEYMAAEKLYELHADERFDLVVIDTPPTRNALDFLDAPNRLVRFLDHRLYRALTAPTRAGLKVAAVAAQTFLKGLTKVVGGAAIDEVVAFFRAFEGMESGFRDRAAAVTSLLRSAETAYVIVTSPRREAVDEAVFFADHLQRQGLAVSAVVANRVHPMFGPGLDDDTIAGAQTRSGDKPGTATTALLDNLELLRGIARSERRALARLAGPRLVSVPLLGRDVHDLASLAAIAGHLVSNPSDQSTIDPLG